MLTNVNAVSMFGFREMKRSQKYVLSVRVRIGIRLKKRNNKKYKVCFSYRVVNRFLTMIQGLVIICLQSLDEQLLNELKQETEELKR